jgi:hypothetical protein
MHHRNQLEAAVAIMLKYLHRLLEVPPLCRAGGRPGSVDAAPRTFRRQHRRVRVR